MANEPKFGPENTEDHLGLCFETSQLSLGKGIKTASATAGAATLNQPSGIITTESITTAAAGAAVYTLTLTNNKIVATDIVQVTVGNNTNSQGNPVVSSVKPAAGSVVIQIINGASSGAFNGTLNVMFNLVKV